MRGGSLHGCNLGRQVGAFEVNLVEMVVRVVCFLFESFLLESLKVVNEKDIYRENVSLIHSEDTASAVIA